MADAVARWTSRKSRSTTLPSGTSAKVHLVDVAQMLFNGIFPAPIQGAVRSFEFGKLDLTKLDKEATDNWERGRARILAEMLDELDGEPVTLSADDLFVPDSESEEEAWRIPLEDRDYLWAVQQRAILLPPDITAAETAEEDSPKSAA